MAFRDFNLASVGAFAAELLVRACGSGDDLHAGTVRGLAEDLGRGLSSETADSPVEAALLCADLATLASCNVSQMPDDTRRFAVAAAHLAAGTARALVALAEAGLDAEDGAYAENARRDLRSAGWKADLAVRQLEKTD